MNDFGTFILALHKYFSDWLWSRLFESISMYDNYTVGIVYIHLIWTFVDSCLNDNQTTTSPHFAYGEQEIRITY